MSVALQNCIIASRHQEGTRVRDLPSLKGKIVALIPNAPTAVRLNKNAVTQADGVSWVPVDPGDGKIRYVSINHIFIRMPDETHPLPGEDFDLVDYMFGAVIYKEHPHIWSLDHKWSDGSTGTEYFRIEASRVSGIVTIWKNKNYEVWGVTPQSIIQIEDRSPNEEEYYICYSPGAKRLGSVYMPRMVRVGMVYRSEADVEFHFKGSNTLSRGTKYRDVRWRLIKEVIPEYIFPSGEIARNVLVVEEFLSDPAMNAPANERKLLINKKGYGSWQGLEGSEIKGSSWYTGTVDPIKDQTYFLADTEQFTMWMWPELDPWGRTTYETVFKTPLYLEFEEEEETTMPDPTPPPKPVPSVPLLSMLLAAVMIVILVAIVAFTLETGTQPPDPDSTPTQEIIAPPGTPEGEFPR